MRKKNPFLKIVFKINHSEFTQIHDHLKEHAGDIHEKGYSLKFYKQPSKTTNNHFTLKLKPGGMYNFSISGDEEEGYLAKLTMPLEMWENIEQFTGAFFGQYVIKNRVIDLIKSKRGFNWVYEIESSTKRLIVSRKQGYLAVDADHPLYAELRLVAIDVDKAEIQLPRFMDEPSVEAEKPRMQLLIDLDDKGRQRWHEEIKSPLWDMLNYRVIKTLHDTKIVTKRDVSEVLAVMLDDSRHQVKWILNGEQADRMLCGITQTRTLDEAVVYLQAIALTCKLIPLSDREYSFVDNKGITRLVIREDHPYFIHLKEFIHRDKHALPADVSARLARHLKPGDDYIQLLARVSHTEHALLTYFNQFGQHHPIPPEQGAFSPTIIWGFGQRTIDPNAGQKILLHVREEGFSPCDEPLIKLLIHPQLFDLMNNWCKLPFELIIPIITRRLDQLEAFEEVEAVQKDKVERESHQGSEESNRTFQTMLDKRAAIKVALNEDNAALEALRQRILTQQREAEALDLAIEQFKAISHLL